MRALRNASDNSLNSGGDQTSTTTPSINTPTIVIPETETGEAIQNAVNKGETPVINIGTGSQGVDLAGSDLLANAEKGEDLVVSNGTVKTAISPELVKELKIDENSKVEITFSPETRPVDKNTTDDLTKIDPMNKELVKDVYNVEMIVDGKIATETENPVKITIDVSEMNLTDEQKATFTGVYFDTNLKTYKILGGEFGADGKSFAY